MYLFAILFLLATIVALAFIWDAIDYLINKWRIIRALRGNSFESDIGLTSLNLINSYRVKSKYVYGILRDLESDGHVSVRGERPLCRYEWRK